MKFLQFSIFSKYLKANFIIKDNTPISSDQKLSLSNTETFIEKFVVPCDRLIFVAIFQQKI